MPAGLLEVQGTIDVSQFWPSGTSDADTTKVILKVGANAIKFRKNENSPSQTTHVFENAKVRGKTGSKEPLKGGKVTIRLQGIDAPELHYMPAPLSKAEKQGLSQAKLTAYHDVTHSYRQLLGATTTKALHDFLAQGGATTFDCRVFTRIDKPNDAFDTYGRLIGDIEVTKSGQKVNLNHLLVEQGLAFPTFYSSMTNDEINAYLALAKTARSKKLGVWKFLSKTIGPFDFTLLEPKKNDLTVLPTDKGSALFPKLYRRYTSWSARNKAKVIKLTFQKYLNGNGKPDDCFTTADFLANGVHSATHHGFDEFVVAGKTIKFEPDGLVFSEAASTLVGPDGKPITHF
jgi:endonuclease YncB( thermonuclease family)